MAKYRESITEVQFAIIIISTILGVSLLGLPKFVIDKTNTAAPLASIIGIGMGFVGLLAITLLGKRFSNQTIIGYSQTILGKKVGKFFSVLLIIFFLLLMGLETRHFAEVIAVSLLPNTPLFVSIFLMIFLCATISFHSVSIFAYVHFFYFPLIILSLLIILIPSIKNIEMYHLLPLTGHNVPIQTLFSGGLNITQAISNFMVISMLIPFMSRPKLAVKSGIWGYLIGSLFIFSLVTVSLAVFGPEEIKLLFWPTLILGRMAQIPGDIFTRMDSILLIAWIFAVFTTLYSYYYFYVRGVAELTKSANYKLISLGGFPIVFIIALFPQDIYSAYKYVLNITLSGLILMIIFPVFLLILSSIRRKKEVSE